MLIQVQLQCIFEFFYTFTPFFENPDCERNHLKNAELIYSIEASMLIEAFNAVGTCDSH